MRPGIRVEFRPIPPGLPGAGSAAGRAAIPSPCPGRGPGCMGRSASEEAVRRGQSRRRPRRRVTGGGADRSATSRLAAGEGKLSTPPSPAVGGRACVGLLQAADPPVAQAVEDEVPAAGRAAATLAMLLASFPRRAMMAASISAGDRVRGDPLDGFDQRPAQHPRALAWRHARGRPWRRTRGWRGVSPAQEHSWPAFANRVTSPISRR